MERKNDSINAAAVQLHGALEEMLDDLIYRSRGPFKSDIFSVAQAQDYMCTKAGYLDSTELQHITNYLRRLSKPLPSPRYRINHYNGKGTRSLRLRSIRDHGIWATAPTYRILKEHERYRHALDAPLDRAAHGAAAQRSVLIHSTQQRSKPTIGTPEYREYISGRYKRETKRKLDEPRVKAELRESRRKRASFKAKQLRQDEAEASREAAAYREGMAALTLKWDDGSGPMKKVGYQDLQKSKRLAARVATYKPQIRRFLAGGNLFW